MNLRQNLFYDQNIVCTQKILKQFLYFFHLGIHGINFGPSVFDFWVFLVCVCVCGGGGGSRLTLMLWL
jgi:hypothetical protein